MPRRAVTRSAAEAVKTARLPVRIRLARPVPRAAMTVAVRLAAAWLPHREFRFLAFGNVAFGPWQRRPDQPAMHGTIVFTAFVFPGIGLRATLGVGSKQFRVGHFGTGRGLGVVHRIGFVGNWFLCGCLRGRNRARARLVETVLRQRACFLATRRRSLGLLVFVLGVTR